MIVPLPHNVDWSPTRCVVVGASGGIGSAFVRGLLAKPGVERVYGLSRSPLTDSDPKLSAHSIDYQDGGSLEAVAQSIKEEGPLDLVIVATGLLHSDDGFGPEKSLKDLDAERLARAYLVNTIGPALVARHFLPLLKRDEKTVFAALSARVGSISDNRVGGWYGYRAAKAALNQIIRTASIEHGRRWPESVVMGLHPGTVDTGLSKPFQRNVSDGKLFTADYSADAMLNVIGSVSAKDTGKCFAYDGLEVPA